MQIVTRVFSFFPRSRSSPLLFNSLFNVACYTFFPPSRFLRALFFDSTRDNCTRYDDPPLLFTSLSLIHFAPRYFLSFFLSFQSGGRRQKTMWRYFNTGWTVVFRHAGRLFGRAIITRGITLVGLLRICRFR